MHKPLFEPSSSTCANLLAEEIRQDLLAAEEYADKHGSFTDLMREPAEPAD